jgi:hypothetical protein
MITYFRLLHLSHFLHKEWINLDVVTNVYTNVAILWIKRLDFRFSKNMAAVLIDTGRHLNTTTSTLIKVVQKIIPCEHNVFA